MIEEKSYLPVGCVGFQVGSYSSPPHTSNGDCARERMTPTWLVTGFVLP